MKFFYPYLFFFAGISCQAQLAKLSPDDFEKALAVNTVQLLDVRTAGEYQSGHLPKALQADWTNLPQFTERVQHLDKKKPLYIYCLVGSRSAAAASWLRANGFASVTELQGGINAWKRNGKPVEGVASTRQMTPEEYRASIPGNQTVLVDFGASWCPPCVKMEPVLQELRRDSSLHFTLLKIDAGIHTNLMKALDIEPIPVFIVYKNGRETWRRQGLVSLAELKSALR